MYSIYSHFCIFPDFPGSLKFPDLFQFSLTCRNPALKLQQMSLRNPWVAQNLLDSVQALWLVAGGTLPLPKTPLPFSIL